MELRGMSSFRLRIISWRLSFVGTLFPLFDSTAQNIDYAGSCLWTGAVDISTDGIHAYCAFQNGLVILDINNPSAPTIVSQTYCPGEGTGLCAGGDFVYLCTHDDGLQIIDISNPQIPQVVGSVTVPGFARDVYELNSYACVAGDYSGLHIIDIADPQNATLLSTFNTTGLALDVFVGDTLAFIAD